METSTRNPNVTVGAFDPKSPSTLMIASSSSAAATSQSQSFSAFLADDGIGCNPEETSALMRLIDVRDKFQNDPEYAEVYLPKTLIKAYRNEIIECMQQWELRISENVNVNGNENENESLEEARRSQEKEDVSLELLKLTHTFAHLSEIYLLNDDAANDEGTSMGMGMGMGMTKSTAGIVTAETIRYLRFNHMMDPNAYLERTSSMGVVVDMERLLEMDQPEFYEPSTSGSNGNNSMPPYWRLFRKLVLRGCLDEAWAVLSRHSMCKRCNAILSSSAAIGNYVDPSVKEDNEAFALIQALLLSAPIPGGRNDANDDYLSFEQDDTGMEDMELLGGIPRDAYKQWDIDANPEGSEFNIHSVLNIYKTWKSTVSEMLKVHVPLRNLCRRIPMLQTCLFDLILDASSCYEDEDVWSERLTAELIYVRPQICREDIHIRTADHVDTCSTIGSRAEINKHVENVILQTMKGDAGAVIQALNDYGGGSSAALPATMTALLCNLLVDSGKIELSQLSFDIETELFLSASSAILSSFAMQNFKEIGVRLSTRLLHPLVIPENTRVTATVAEMLCRHWSKSDADTHFLLESCKDSVSRGSRRMLDACDSLGFSRSMHYVKTGNVEKSIYFLLRGIEYSAMFGSELNDTSMTDATRTAFSHTTCFRRLTSTCSTSAEFVLDQIFQCFSAQAEDIDVATLSKPLQAGRIIVDTIAADDVGHLLKADPSISLLKHVIDIGLNLIIGETPDAAKSIINCLQDQVERDGSIIVLAHSGLYGYLLSCAYDILIAEETTGDLVFAKSSFDLKGMQVLFSRYTQYSTKEKVNIHQDASSNLRPDITTYKMKEALGKGLMRAFIAENAKASKVDHKATVLDSISITEQSVEQLLGPSL